MSILNSKNMLILGLVAFMVMSFWSLFSMPTDMNGKMVSCPFMEGSSSFCQMSVFGHINAWQRFFTVPQEKNLLLFLFFLLTIFSVSFFIAKEHENKTQYQRLHNYLYRYKPEIKIFHNLVLAFSDGIIHSKIYA